MNAQDMAAVMQSAAGLSDDMATMMENQAATMALSGVAFWAFDMGDVGAGFASNVNIIKQPSLNISLDLIEQLSVNQLESLDMLAGRKVASESRARSPAGEALHLTYEVGAKDAANADITATTSSTCSPATTASTSSRSPAPMAPRRPPTPSRWPSPGASRG